VLLGIVVLLAYRLEFTDTFPVHTQGFFCYDSTYAKPYPGPEAASRAPPALIYALVTAGPALTVRWCGSPWSDRGEDFFQEARRPGGGWWSLGLKARKTPPWSCPQILLGELARAFFPAPPSASPIVGESTIVSGACCRFSPPLRRLVRFLGERCSPGSALWFWGGRWVQRQRDMG
jgi:lipid phosphate phosphatase-related protein type 1/2/5